MRVRDLKQATLAELEHGLSTEPGAVTKGYIWRTLVTAFWLEELRASNWTREQLREIGHCCLRSGKELPSVAPGEGGMVVGAWLDKQNLTGQHIVLNGRAETRDATVCEGDEVHIIAPLSTLPFERISGLARRAYCREFKQRYLDELLLNTFDARRCLSGAEPKRPSNRPGDDKLTQRINRVLNNARERVERGASFSSVAEWLMQQRKNEGWPLETLKKILSGRYPPMKRLRIEGLKRD